ncbi:hypothetical protein [Planococcus lenghuensis]|uniref:Secreted protein n=1 Tax=Planococcus lenghuensis TaxID=2213202 RepID=A0A1Q2L4K1_9BACL|nr:hypothetical protein [Planococcus lenghuensis]AQQ55304.1 hypothetical protein B0X71_19195 [Planococcus lenghuensis]
MENHNQHGHGVHHQPETSLEQADIRVGITYESGTLTATVRDRHGDLVELADTHEKRMHLIVVSKDLTQLFHLHPIEEAPGDFKAAVDLQSGHYLAFADINPTGQMYTITPNHLTVGQPQSVQSANLSPAAIEDNTQQVVAGKVVNFHHSELTTEHPVTLSFNLHGETPLPYLGALGHVVVIDEQGQKFIHVHPSSKDESTFEAQFPFPGFYKLWAEFKFSDQGVFAFPFVIHVQGER